MIKKMNTEIPFSVNCFCFWLDEWFISFLRFLLWMYIGIPHPISNNRIHNKEHAQNTDEKLNICVSFDRSGNASWSLTNTGIESMLVLSFLTSLFVWVSCWLSRTKFNFQTLENLEYSIYLLLTRFHHISTISLISKKII